MKKAVSYIRADDKRAAQGDSFRRQRESVQAMLDKFNLVLDKEFSEIKYGNTLNRQVLKEMLDYIKNKKNNIEFLIIEYMGKLSTDSDNMQFIFDELEKAKVRLIEADMYSANGVKFQTQIMAAVNTYIEELKNDMSNELD